MTNSDDVKRRRKKRILMLDEPYVIDALKPTIEFWGFDLIGISKADFIQDVILRHEIDLLILAGEMRVAGPSLEGHFGGKLHERISGLKNTVIDREFGAKVESRLQECGVKVPIIYLSTEDMDGPKLFCDDHGKLRSAIFPKPDEMFKESFKQAVEELLGSES